jgi:hypothetical protein
MAGLADWSWSYRRLEVGQALQMQMAPMQPKGGRSLSTPRDFYVFFIHTDAMMQVVHGPSRRCMHIYPDRCRARFASRFNWYGKVLPRGVINSRAVQNRLFCKPLLIWIGDLVFRTWEKYYTWKEDTWRFPWTWYVYGLEKVCTFKCHFEKQPETRFF